MSFLDVITKLTNILRPDSLSLHIWQISKYLRLVQDTMISNLYKSAEVTAQFLQPLSDTGEEVVR